MTKVEWTSLSEIVAGYDPVSDVIILNKKLRLPENKKLFHRAYDHELKHAEAGKSITGHLKVDLIDNWKHFFDYDIINQSRSVADVGIWRYKMYLINTIVIVFWLVPSFIQAFYFLFKRGGRQ